MPGTESIPIPSLYSSNQDEEAFLFEKYTETGNPRKHLSLDPIEEQDLQHLINKYYSIDEIVEFIKTKPECKRITLQFPDQLICDSAAVASEISTRLKFSTMNCKNNKCSCGSSDETCDETTDETESKKEGEKQSVWILADTSYSPCCVDEVAAEHIKGDMAIHFGDACLNPVDKVQVGYVFGKPVVDINDILEQFKSTFDISNKVVLMADAPHSYLLNEMYQKLSKEYTLGYGDISKDSFPEASIIGYNPKESGNALQTLNRNFHNIEGNLEDALLSYSLFHIGVPETPRLLKLTTVFESVTLYNPQENKILKGPFPNLMRRYKNMLTAKSAGTIGLLVNTLSISNTKVLLNQLKHKIKNADKKHYMFVVGKPNVAKLANFDTIDVWCILGCDHQGIIIDQYNEYFKPIITPFELLLALNEELSWTGKWETDFSKLVEQLGEEDDPSEDKEDNTNTEDVEPVFDPITGNFALNSKPLRRRDYLSVSNGPEVTETGLVQRFSQDVVIKDTVSTAAINLQERHWKGLGTDYDDQEIDSKGSLVEDGRSGVARGYDFDVGKDNK